MFSRLREGATYANVVASLALFLAIAGGGAWALSGRNSVHSKDLARGSVRSSDIRNHGVRAVDLKPGVVPGAVPGVVSASDSSQESTTLQTTFASVLTAQIVVPVRSRLMGSASVGLQSDGTTATGFGLCQMNHGLGQLHGALAPNGGTSVRSRTVLALNGAVVVEPGTYAVQVNCKKDGTNQLAFFEGDLIVWAVPLAS